MNTKTHPNNLELCCYNSAHLVQLHEYNNHEYSDRVGLLIQNRMTGHYASKFTVPVIIQVIYNSLHLAGDTVDVR